MTTLTPIDFRAVAASAGDLRDIIAGHLGPPDYSGKFRCPFHGDGNERTPSLQVWPDHYHCFACGEHGDALTWVARRENLTPVQAAKRLDPSIVTAEDLRGRRTPDHRVRRPQDHPPTPPPPPPLRAPEPEAKAAEIWTDPAWQARLSALVRHAEAMLWSPAGRPALGWLLRRGLSEQTIRRFRLGFLDARHRTAPIPHWRDDRGRPRVVRAERGITIPWVAPGAWYSEYDEPPEGPRWVGMNVRRLADDVDAPLPDGVDKCRAVAGSKRGRLYPHPTIEPTQGRLPILLVEGEFDALIGHQLAGHALHVGTVGSASVSTRSLPAATRAALARCTWLLLALDMDAAGAEGARRWREAYPHKARRVLLPAGKDLNEFVRGGGDLAGWLAEIRGRMDRWTVPSTCTGVGVAGPGGATVGLRSESACRLAAQEPRWAVRGLRDEGPGPDGRGGLPAHPGPFPSRSRDARTTAEVRRQFVGPVGLEPAGRGFPVTGMPDEEPEA